MSSELVAVELQLKGYDGVMSDMRALDQMLNSFRGRKNRIEIESNLAKAKQEVIAYRGEINKLNGDIEKQKKEVVSAQNKMAEATRKSEEAYKNFGKAFMNSSASYFVKKQVADASRALDVAKAKLEEQQEALDNTKASMKDSQQAIREYQYALKNFSSTSFGKAFNQLSSVMAHFGSAMQSAGNALTRLTSPFRRFTSGIIMGAGYKALNKFTEGFDSAFSRADTMRKYPRVMQSFGYTADEAETSIKKLDASVQGLPTALDDIVNMSQRFTMTVGDLQKGTDLAIASNNAFLASMSTETQQYQGMMQLQDVLGGKKMNAREWYSLANSMMPAIRMMGESLGYTGEALDEYVSKVQQGKISNEEFIDTLIKAGADENGKIRKVAMEAMDTWEAFFSRIRTASSRFGYGIIESLNSIVETVTNGKFKSVNMLLDDYVISGIDNMTKSVKGWIKAHPQEITDFFKSLKEINFGSIAKGVGEALLTVSKYIKSFADMFGGKDLSWLGKFMVYGNMLGNFLTIAGGLVKGSRGIIAGLGASIFKGIMAIKGIRKWGLMGWLGTMVVGEESGKTEEVMKTVAKTSPKMGKFSLGLSNIFKGWAEIATMIIGSAGVAWGSMKLLKGAVKDFGEMVDIIKGIDWDVGAEALLGIGAFFTAFGGLSTLAGANIGATTELLFGAVGVGLFTTLIAGFGAIDMALIKSSFKSFRDSVKYLNEGIEGLNELGTVADVGTAKTNIKNAVTLFNQVTDLLEPERNTPTGGSEGKVKSFSKKTAKSLSNLSSAVGSIKNSIATLNEISGMKVNTHGLTNVMPQVESALDLIGGMLDRLPEGLGTSGTAENLTNFNSIIANFKSALDGLVGENGILTQIPKVIQQTTGFSQYGIYNQFVQRVDEMSSAIRQAYAKLNSGIGNGEFMASNLANIAKAIGSVRDISQELGKLSVSSDNIGGGTRKISGIIDNIKSAFNAEAIEGVVTQINTFVTSVQDALQAVTDLGAEPIELDIQFKLSSGFYSSKRKVISEIKSAKKEINSQKSPISFSIPVRVFFSVITNLGSALAKITSDRQEVERQATGASTPITPHISTGGWVSRQGVLYRSGGGSIFKPRGTDKIPAMLAEGEYVQRKQATDFWGVDFMRKVNAMDVRGAMQAMLTKAGNATNIGRQSIFNNTVNNNQRITQNINTNNPSFARMQVGRFAGAL